MRQLELGRSGGVGGRRIGALAPLKAATTRPHLLHLPYLSLRISINTLLTTNKYLAQHFSR
jgi:hypothetical protein